MSENPKLREMYMRVAILNPVAWPVVLLSAVSPAPIFATCVPANAKKRNMVVPMNSPIIATISIGRLD